MSTLEGVLEMKIQADCVPCLMKRILFQSRLAEGADDFRSVESAVRALADNISSEKRSVDVATPVHAASYAVLGNDPYHDLKVEADEVAGRFVDTAQEIVDRSDDPLRAALLVSVIGNIMDFGSGVAIDDPSEFEGVFQQLVDQGIGSDDTDRLRSVLENDGDVVYIFDNCGESQLDKVMIRHLRSMGKRVVGVVRGAPILNDVTYEDAVRSGLDRELDALMTTGKFYIGVDPEDMPSDLVAQLERTCVIIAKGMANYESLSDEALVVPIAHVLRAKCVPVANSLGVEVGTNVVRLREPEAIQ